MRPWKRMHVKRDALTVQCHGKLGSYTLLLQMNSRGGGGSFSIANFHHPTDTVHQLTSTIHQPPANIHQTTFTVQQTLFPSQLPLSTNQLPTSTRQFPLSTFHALPNFIGCYVDSNTYYILYEVEGEEQERFYQLTNSTIQQPTSTVQQYIETVLDVAFTLSWWTMEVSWWMVEVSQWMVEASCLVDVFLLLLPQPIIMYDGSW